MFFNRAILVYDKHFLDLVTFSEFKENFPDFRKNKEGISIVEYPDYQIPVTQLKRPKGN